MPPREPQPFAPVAITGLGAITPIGGGAAQTCASIRAGLNRFEDYPYYNTLTPDPEWDEPEPLVASRSAGVALGVQGPDRMLALALPALREALEDARLLRRQMKRAALLLALPEDHPSLSRWNLDVFAEALLQRGGLTEHLPQVTVAAHGNAGALRAVAQASSLLHRRGADACLVLAADTYFAPERLRALDEEKRLKSSFNPDGFLPGEAACALVLETEESARARGRTPLGVIRALAEATESQPFTSDKQSTGAGLTNVLRALLPGAGERFVLTDHNGESYRAFEWGVARVRVGERLGEVKELLHPAMSVGDVGAAAGALQIACAVAAFERGYAPAPEALVLCGSDSGLRAGARVEPR
ncbi:MAG TPA: hypothetical protein VFA20_25830 [Myxococcaceae bacterium]|nr:hypothetical protein [Myxococcaceae bacterium]